MEHLGPLPSINGITLRKSEKKRIGKYNIKNIQKEEELESLVTGIRVI